MFQAEEAALNHPSQTVPACDLVGKADACPESNKGLLGKVGVVSFSIFYFFTISLLLIFIIGKNSDRQKEKKFTYSPPKKLYIQFILPNYLHVGTYACTCVYVYTYPQLYLTMCIYLCKYLIGQLLLIVPSILPIPISDIKSPLPLGNDSPFLTSTLLGSEHQ